MKVEDDTYQLKPMNCPCHIAIYKDSLHSYRELPIRWAELGTVYRYEKSGTMHGLFRVRGFTQVSPNSTKRAFSMQSFIQIVCCLACQYNSPARPLHSLSLDRHQVVSLATYLENLGSKNPSVIGNYLGS
jgi:hypothetical protein